MLVKKKVRTFFNCHLLDVLKMIELIVWIMNELKMKIESTDKHTNII